MMFTSGWRFGFVHQLQRQQRNSGSPKAS